MSDRTLDYVARLDERNRAHRLTATDPTLLQKPRYWTPGTQVLDQGQEGACVGFGCTGEYMASPFRGRPVDPNRYAQGVYEAAKQIDEWEGVDYDGTSVRAGMLVGRQRQFWDSFKWAFNMNELRAALEQGPIVIGVEWRSGMYQAPGGRLLVTGSVVGGHCILVTGYQASYNRYRLRNSWGPTWGNNGSAYIAAVNLNQILFKAGGEAAIPVGRKA